MPRIIVITVYCILFFYIQTNLENFTLALGMVIFAYML